MDVTFTNVLEGARQYFQGLPATSDSTAGPTTTFSTSEHTENYSTQTNEVSFHYWQQEKEGSFNYNNSEQISGLYKSALHHPDSTASNHSHYTTNIPLNENVQSTSYKQPSFSFHHEGQDTYQFPKQISRDSTHNLPMQQQFHESQFMAHIPTSSNQNQYSQTSTNYQNYSQSQSYYRPQFVKVIQSNANSEPASSTYSSQSSYKPAHLSQNFKLNNQQQIKTESQFQKNDLPSHYLGSHTPNNLKSVTNNQNAANNQYRTKAVTIPPINYHGNNKNRLHLHNNVPTSQSLTNSILPQEIVQMNENITKYQNLKTISYNQDIPTAAVSRSYTTASTYLLNDESMKSTSTSMDYTKFTDSQSMMSSKNNQDSSNHNLKQIARMSQMTPVTSKSSNNHLENFHGNTMNENINLFSNVKQKRESPLDLSVKTVKTSADSTHNGPDNGMRNKRFSTCHPSTPLMSTHNYPTYDVNKFNKISKIQFQETGAPKIEFNPNFNVSSLNNNSSLLNLKELNYKKNNKQQFENYHASLCGKGHLNASVPEKSQHSFYNQAQNKNIESKLLMLNNKSAFVKRHSDPIMSHVVPNKMPKMVDPWRQTIDKEIDQRLSRYQQQQKQEYHSLNNKSYLSNNQEQTNQLYHQPLRTQYSYGSSQAYAMTSEKTKLGDFASHSMLSNCSNQMSPKSNIGADKRVLSLLRNSLEIKGQRKVEVQKCSNDNLQTHTPKIPHPSTDVTAPLQPKPNFSTRNNLSPFTPSHYPESNTSMALYKSNFPKAIDSVNFEIESQKGNFNDNSKTAENQCTLNTEYDGLAAFLAARIRTKGELKQCAPTQVSNNKSTTLHGIIEDQLKSPIKSEYSHQSNCNSRSNKKYSSIAKSRANILPPRRRLFSKNEDDTGVKSAPQRDRSGMRSSSETSVFDFPDSDCEIESSIEQQSLVAMRKDRKVLTKASNNDTPLDSSTEDDVFKELCDSFVKQLKEGTPHKRKYTRKKNRDSHGNKNKINSPGDVLNILNEIKDSDKTNPQIDCTFSKNQDNNTNVGSSDLVSGNTTESEQQSLHKSFKVVETISNIKKEHNTDVLLNKIAKKPLFGDGSDFYPGWEEGVYKYKKSLRMPASLIQISRPPQIHRLSTSLPDLDPYPNSPITESNELPEKTKASRIKQENDDTDNESTSSVNLFNKHNYDSEGSTSSKHLQTVYKEGSSIIDKLLEKCGGHRKRKYKRKEEDGPKLIPKSDTPLELLPTPSLELREQNNEHSKNVTSVNMPTSPMLNFRKITVKNFKDAFINSYNIINEQFSTVVYNSRTRKEAKVLQQRATIKEVFGEERPASAPPITCINDIHKLDMIGKENRETFDQNFIGIIKNTIETKNKNVLITSFQDDKIKREIEVFDTLNENKSLASDKNDMDFDIKLETCSVSGDDSTSNVIKKRNKFRSIRRKFSSGFDYIRKKKKSKRDGAENDQNTKTNKKRNIITKSGPESVQDIQKEMKTWVLNKGIGETHLHRAARLGYTDITAYCLDQMKYSPSPKDNAGYTPLHEACSRGHLDIAKLLLLFGANVGESAQGGIRPLHEAVENGFVEIVRLLLAYGADPQLATYSGLTPLALANDDITAQLLKDHLEDIDGNRTSAWIFLGPSSCFEPTHLGYNIVEDVPQSDPELDDSEIEFELSDYMLPNLYTLNGDTTGDRWILLQDLSSLLKVKSKEALLRQISSQSTLETLSSNNDCANSAKSNKSILCELKMSDFLDKARCSQFLNTGEKINTRASKIALVKYTDRVKELLNVEKIIISFS